MPDMQEALKSAVPGLPAVLSKATNGEIAYTLWHRKKSNVFPSFKVFFFTSDFRAAIARGKRHCEEIGEVFIRVSPLISNLDEEEKKYQGDT